MSTTHATGDRIPRKPLRLWPGVVAASIVVLLRFIVPLFVAGSVIYGVLAGVAGGAVIVLWWLFFSRAPWLERIGAIVLMALATFATMFVVHPSMAGGLMGRMIPFYAVPATLGPAFVAWAVATRRLPDGVRRATMVVTILLACGVWTLVRTDGVKGEAAAQLRWRWSPTAEEQLLAKGDDAPAVAPQPASAPATAPPASPPVPAPSPPPEGSKEAQKKPVESEAPAVTPAKTATPAVARIDWPGVRGPRRDGVVRGITIETDWAKSPPVELWRRPIGPGWSSFAVRGDLFYTQEQRGEEEVVSCYRLSTGQPVWRHRDATRFYESNGGPGPRGTPTAHGDRIYSFGATGIVNALNADTGALVWSRNAAKDTGATMPGWGFTSSPLVVGDAVVVAASGRLVAYDLESGKPRWVQKTVGGGYSSPHVATIDGVEQILMLSGGGVTSVAPKDGQVLWQHRWVEGVAIVQPALDNGDVLITAGDAMGGTGMRRLAVSHESSAWTASEKWTTRGLKPYFNDFVVHKGHAFGFDGTILSCIDLATGDRKWKGGRFGAGQLVLLPEQDLLLVLSEDGELALVSATADAFHEIARVKAIEGKTWNHPALAGGVVLVRNGEEMAAFRLALAGR